MRSLSLLLLLFPLAACKPKGSPGGVSAGSTLIDPGPAQLPQGWALADHGAGFTLGFPEGWQTKSLDRPAIEAGGTGLMAEIEDLIGRFPPFSDEREQFATALYGTGETLKMDGEGRVTLSDQLKDHAGIMDAVAFVGLGHKFQIWAPDPFSARLSEATGKMRALRKRLGTEQAVNPQGARE